MHQRKVTVTLVVIAMLVTPSIGSLISALKSIHLPTISLNLKGKTAAQEPAAPAHAEEQQVFSESDFSYNEEDPTGPSKWKYLNSNCGGARQSPISIETGVTLAVGNAQPFEMIGFDIVPNSIVLENNGHSMHIDPVYNEGQLPKIAGGPLSGVHILDHVHLHWGLTNDHGSEHTLNGRRFPSELHMVTYNGKYSSMAEAQTKPDGLAVLNFFIEIGPTNGPLFFAPHLQHVIQPHSEFTLEGADAFSLRQLLGNVHLDLLTYSGSLTTPPCSEIVTWLINRTPIFLRAEELTALRKLQNSHGHPMESDYRPLQEINGRQVFYYPDN